MIPGLSGETYQDKLAELGLQSLEDRRKRADMIAVYKILSGQDKVDRHKLFNCYGAQSRVTRLSQYPDNIQPTHSNTDIRRNFFTQRIINDWNSLPQDIKESTTTNNFKKKYDDLTRIYSYQ